MPHTQIAGVGSWSRLRTLALGGAVAVVAAACTGGAGSGDKAGGGGEPVVLTMANGYDFFIAKSEPAVSYFVHRVEELSGGALRIKVVDGWGNYQPGAEQQIVRDVEADQADLAWVGTRVFDTLGVKSFQALTAPMLIDNYPLERAVIASDMPGQMLGSLSNLGVTGLAVLADGLRKPIAITATLLGPVEWRGIRFQVFRSTGQAEAVQALGARPTEHAPSKAIEVEVQGAEKNLLNYQVGNRYPTKFPYVTANVNLWPQTVALLANPGRLAKLSAEQRGWVRQAAADASVRSTGMFEDEAAIVDDVCQRGARFANASEADLAALREAFVPVYAALDHDPETKAFIERIDALKRVTPTGPALAIPTGCTGSIVPPPTTDPLAGTWHTGHITETVWVHALIAMGGTEKEGHETFGLNRPFKVVTLRFQDGVFKSYCGGDRTVSGLDQAEVDALLASANPPELCDNGTYEIGDGGTFTLDKGVEGTDTYRYELNGDTLRLHFVKPDCSPGCDSGAFPFPPVGPTSYASFPFTRSN
jgi:TRAP-type C4-dicarboxylate transport system substrate-binding protein